MFDSTFIFPSQRLVKTSATTLVSPSTDGVSVTGSCWGVPFPSTATTALSKPKARSPSPASYRTGTWSGAPPSPAAKVRLRSHFRVIFFIIFFEVEHLPGNKRLSQLPGAAMTKDPRPGVHTTVTCRLPVLETGRPTPA